MLQAARKSFSDGFRINHTENIFNQEGDTTPAHDIIDTYPPMELLRVPKGRPFVLSTPDLDVQDEDEDGNEKMDEVLPARAEARLEVVAVAEVPAEGDLGLQKTEAKAKQADLSDVEL